MNNILNHCLKNFDTVYTGYKNPSTIYRINLYSVPLNFSEYMNFILENGCRIPNIIYVGYKNMFLDSECCS